MMYAMTLLSTNINKMLESVKNDIHECTNHNRFGELNRLSVYCSNITEMRDELERCIDALIEIGTGTADSSKAIETTPTISVHADESVNYSLYKVDPKTEHTLDEDFEHRKVCAFKLDGKRINVDSWQDLTIKTCAYLYKKDPVRMKSFVWDEDLKGRINQYFMTSSVQGRNKLIPGSELYVWINQSANSLARMVGTVLKKYGYHVDDMVIYLRADYSDLHK